MNVLNLWPKTVQPEAMKTLQETRRIDDLVLGHKAFTRFVQTYQGKLFGACLETDRKDLAGLVRRHPIV